MITYYDYLFKFKLADLTTALAALGALRSADIITEGDLPTNMLGTIRDASGALTVDAPAFRGEVGIASITYTDDLGVTVTAPARGDPGYWYVAIRTVTAPPEIPFDTTVYGLIPCAPIENASVLGTWAEIITGDTNGEESN